MIVDADVHIDVEFRKLAPFVVEPWRNHMTTASVISLLPHTMGDQTVGGRIQRPFEAAAGPKPPEVGAEVSIVFPDQLLALALHPNGRLEAAVAEGYARWLTEVFLPAHPEARGMLHLPFSDGVAARRIVAEFGSRPGIVGAYVTNARFPKIHDERYFDLYSELQDRGLVLAFHPNSVWMQQPFSTFDRFLPAWALGHPFSQSVHLINWVFHAMGDRFPGLKCIFYEAGLTWLSFLSHRLDQEYMKRPSEAPLLRERPSRYMRRCYFSTQPLDQVADIAYLEQPIRVVGYRQLAYASNVPRWDFDVPDVINRLPFLSDGERQAILGGNAARLFRLEGVVA